MRRIATFDDPSAARLRNALRALALAFGALYAGAAAYSESMNADGMSYLDMGDAYWSGDWATALNAVWSPLYSWLLGGALALFDPSPAWEFPLVHLVNYLIYIGTLLCFEFFWGEVTRAYGRNAGDDTVGFPAGVWLVMGYALFIWSSLVLIEIWSVTPDMCVAACVYLSAGLLVRIREGRATLRTYLVLGTVLGVGYLVKAALFPLAFVFVVLSALVRAPKDLKRGIGRAIAAGLVFAAVALPFLGVLSSRTGHLTFSDVGQLTYLKHVHGIPFPHWVPGVVEGIGEPDHPPRRVFEEPTVWEFAEPVGGTYPLSYDPYYWYRGVTVKFDPLRQAAAIAVNLGFLLHLLVQRLGGLSAVAVLAGLLAVGARPRAALRAGRWELMAVAGTAFGMYLMVHMTGRYVAAFVVLGAVGTLTHVRLPDSNGHRRLLAVGGALGIAFVGADFGEAAWHNLQGMLNVPGRVEIDSGMLRLDPDPAGGPPRVVRSGSAAVASARPSQVANALLAGGLHRGDEVGFVGYSFDAYWARLARLEIVAEVVPAEAEVLWNADSERRAAALDAFRRAGAVAVVTDRMPPRRALAGWEPVGDTGYRVFRLER